MSAGTITVECNLDSAGWTICADLDGNTTNTSASYEYSGLSVASHTLQIRAKDQVGNISTVDSTTWSQAGYKTIALYHFDSSDVTDSGPNSLTLTDNGCNLAGAASGWNYNASTYSSAQSLTVQSSSGTANYQYVADNAAFDYGLKRFSIQATVKVSAHLASQGNTSGLLAKLSGSNGWKVWLEKRNGSGGAKYYIWAQFGSATVRSPTVDLVVGTYYRIAVTYNKGTAAIYYNGTSQTLTTSGTIPTTITDSGTQLEVGRFSGNTSNFIGQMDEVRISQTVRSGAELNTTTLYTSD
jgi:hypothetical protein